MLHHFFHGSLQATGSSFLNEKSMLFDGTNEYVDMGNPTELNFADTDAFSISVWIKTTDTFGMVVAKQLDSAPFTGWRWGVDNGKSSIEMASGSSNFIRRETTSTGLGDGFWHNIVITYSGSGTAAGVNLYIDDTLQGMATTSDNLSGTIASAATFKVGVRGPSSGQYAGNVDEVSVWDKALSGSEITDIYNSGTPSDLAEHSASANQVGWWRMGDEDDTISSIKDRSTNSNDGTPTNMESGDIVTDTP
jgi:hypothetical protein